MVIAYFNYSIKKHISRRFQMWFWLIFESLGFSGNRDIKW